LTEEDSDRGNIFNKFEYKNELLEKIEKYYTSLITTTSTTD
ncbi:10505_t:CDS:1, partial [Scutellospora calospora]